MKKFVLLLLSISQLFACNNMSMKGIFIPKQNDNLMWSNPNIRNADYNNFTGLKLDTYNYLNGQSIGQVSLFPNSNRSILYYDGFLYISTINKITKMNASTGKIIWSKIYGDYNLTFQQVSFSSMIIHNNHIYLVNSNGIIQKVEIENGNVIWSNNIALPFKSLPLILGNRLYLLSNNDMVSIINMDDGSVLESNNHSFSKNSSILQSGIVDLLPLDEFNIVISYSNGQILSFNYDKNLVNWNNIDLVPKKRNTNNVIQFSNINHTPIRILDKLYVFSSSNNKFIIIDINTGITQKSIDFNINSTSPLRSGNTIFAIDSEDNINAIRSDGKIIWKVGLNEQIRLQIANTSYFKHRLVKSFLRNKNLTWLSPIMVSDKLLIPSSNGLIVMINSQTGELVKLISTNNIFTGEPTIVNGIIYLLTQSGKVFYLK